jgi:hypothetical protein
VSPACACARFVLSVCQIYESVFFAEQTRRKLGGSKIEAQWVEADEILQQRLERQGSGNPRKRSRSQLRDDSSDGAAWGDGDSANEGSESESPERGRSRKR